jgi:hypothetical protein
LPKKKQTAAEIELQLSERRFILEALNTAATVIQVPIVTAFVWWAMSERSHTLRKLNKAIILAELTPKIGDINFPEGVLLGAAAETVDEFQTILEKTGVKVGEVVEKATDLATDTIFDILVPASLNCIQMQGRRRELLAEIERARTDERYPGELTRLNVEWVALVVKIKEKCPDSGAVTLKP